MKRLPSIIMITAFLIGLSVFLYPTISDFVNARNQTRAVASYTADVGALREEDYREILEQARLYNTGLASGGESASKDAAARDYESTLRVGNSDVMGFIEIEKIKVRLPLYHTTKHSVLQVGVGHLQGSSLPVGGKNTHAVLSGHRGLPSSKLFTNLDQLVNGDLFTIHVLDMRLTYRVDRIEVVEPDDVDALEVIPGQDYVTLVTCTPYGVNTHRLLVRGSRIELAVEDSVEASAPISRYSDAFFLVSIAVAVVLITTGLLLYATRHRWE